MPEIVLPEWHLPPPPTPSAARPGGPNPGLALRIDASTPDTLIASLKAAEAALAPDDLNRLRAALGVVQMLFSRKVATVAASSAAPPNLSNEQLMQLAFGDIHGKTVAEVIDYGLRLAPTVLPAADSIE